MISVAPTPTLLDAAQRRFAALGADTAALEALEVAARRPRIVYARRELLVEGLEIPEPLVILDGWAARVRQLPDGRRQVISLLLPGDVIGLYAHERPIAHSSVLAITEVITCVAPAPAEGDNLAQVYAHSRALEELYLMAQITRLGRLNAFERLSDLLLELFERLELLGLAHDGRFTTPITQELLADMLGLTSVHVNRTLQTMRRDGELIWKGRDVWIKDTAALSERIARPLTRVTAEPSRA